jgi:hypothetical protein
MAVVDVAVAPPDASPLHRLIRRTRLLLRTTRTATGVALTLGLFLGALALVVALDLLLPLLQLPFWFAHGIDVGLRLASLCLVVAPPAVACLFGVVIPLCRRLTAGRVARRIESHLPGIHNRLVSCIDLEARGRAAASPVFYRRLVRESLERIDGFRPSHVLNFIELRRAVLIAVLGAAAFALVAGLFWNKMPAAMARIFRPFDEIPPVGAAAFTVQPRGGDFLREEKIDLSAEVTRGRPGALTLQLWADDGATKEIALQPTREEPSSFRLALDTVSIGQSFQKGFDYRVHGAGTWSDRYHVRLVERPIITSVDTAVFYPKYMAIPETHPTPREASEIIGPEGGEIEVAIQAEGQVKEGEIQLLKAGVRQVPAGERIDRVWFRDEAPAGAKTDVVWGQEGKEGRPAHTDPYSDQLHRHGFQDDPAGFAVEKGDALFADVFIDPQNPPSEILLQWNDGKEWRHAAYWGADLIPDGVPGTASRYPMGRAPEPGRWMRLEAPASALGLEGATLHGVEFVLKGGRCWWGGAGAVRVEEPAYEVDQRFSMQADGSGRWVGRLTLEGKGVFRAELRNEQGYPNKAMAELRFSTVKDRPPQIVLQRPGPEMTLSQPQAPPLTIAAYDDYGLADVLLFWRTDPSKPYQSRILRHFDKPERSQMVVAPLDEVKELKQGGALYYHLEALDRKPQWNGPGQRARTPETDAVVRIAADANAADVQEAVFDKTEDTFHDRLVQLIAEQKKVQTNVDKLTGQYAQMTEKLRKDQEAAQPTAPVDPTKPPPPKEGPKIDPETAKQLAELQKQLAELAKEEEKNSQAASQLNNDLATAADQADKLQTLPQPLVQQMQALQQAFEQTAVHGMQNLTQQFNQGANPQAGAPNLPDIGQKTDRLSKDLEGVKDRMDALDAARKGLRDDLDKVMAELRQKMLNENGKLTERDLQDLRDFLARMREQMKDLQNQQQNLLDAAENGGDMKDLEQKQADLDKQMQKLLAAARKMLDAKRNTRRRPNYPDAPYTPNDDDVKAPPKDADSDAPLPNAKKPDGKNDHADDKKPDEAKGDEEPLDMPALGGPRQVPDPRYDKKRRPVEKKPGDKDAQRDDLEDRQNDRLRDLDAAEKSLASDQQTLEQMLHGLEQAMQKNNQGRPHSGQPSEADEAMQELQDMLQSPAMRQVRDMLGRMRRAQAAQARRPGQPGQNQASMASQSQSSQTGNNPSVNSPELSGLPLDTRQAILKLPPRVREELMQGLREQGPEGYGPFIEDYFKRLTESKNP